MTILIDADVCLVTDPALATARCWEIRAVEFCDTEHLFSHLDAETVMVGQGPEVVDLALMNQYRFGDLVITQDYGCAALAHMSFGET